MTVYENPYRCWEVALGEDYVEHHQNREDAEDAARYTAPARPFHELPGACWGATCDECGTDYEDTDTGSPVHLGSLKAALSAIEAAGWTTDETASVVHCSDCPDLGVGPLVAFRTPAPSDVPLFTI
jgi:hypothetical protein